VVHQNLCEYFRSRTRDSVEDPVKQRAVPLGQLREPETPAETPVAVVPPSH